MVETHSSRLMECAIMVEMILAVRMERMLALTPDPKPSARTKIMEDPCSMVST